MAVFGSVPIFAFKAQFARSQDGMCPLRPWRDQSVRRAGLFDVVLWAAPSLSKSEDNFLDFLGITRKGSRHELGARAVREAF